MPSLSVYVKTRKPYVLFISLCDNKKALCPPYQFIWKQGSLMSSLSYLTYLSLTTELVGRALLIRDKFCCRSEVGRNENQEGSSTII